MNNLETKGAFTVNEFLAWASVGRTSAYAAIARGELKAVKFGHKTLIPYESAKAWLNSLPEAA